MVLSYVDWPLDGQKHARQLAEKISFFLDLFQDSFSFFFFFSIRQLISFPYQFYFLFLLKTFAVMRLQRKHPVHQKEIFNLEPESTGLSQCRAGLKSRQ